MMAWLHVVICNMKHLLFLTSSSSPPPPTKKGKKKRNRGRKEARKSEIILKSMTFFYDCTSSMFTSYASNIEYVVDSRVESKNTLSISNLHLG